MDSAKTADPRLGESLEGMSKNVKEKVDQALSPQSIARAHNEKFTIPNYVLPLIYAALAIVASIFVVKKCSPNQQTPSESPTA
jgi:hypothetical protein